VGSYDNLGRDGNSSVPVPKYYVVLNILRESFAGFKRGDRVPSENELSKQFGVSRVTLQRALAQLVSEGVIVRVQGKGTFYAGDNRTPKVQAISGALESLMIYENGARAKVVAKARTRELPTEIRAFLRLAHTDEAVILKRVAIVGVDPFAYIVNYLPQDIGDKVFDEDKALTHSTIIYLLREKHHIPLTRAEQTITAALADPEVSKALNISIGSPVLRIERGYFTREDRPVQFTRSWYRSDLYKYTLTLKGWDTGSEKNEEPVRQSSRRRRGVDGKPQRLNRP